MKIEINQDKHHVHELENKIFKDAISIGTVL